RRGEEGRILARLEHPHHPVDRGVGVAAAETLDEGGDDVVVLLARLVVAERTLLRGLLEERQVEAPGSTATGEPRRQLERVERDAGIALGMGEQEGPRFGHERGAGGGAPAPPGRRGAGGG